MQLQDLLQICSIQDCVVSSHGISSHLIILWYHSSNFIGLSCRSCIYLDLYLSISFWRGANPNCIVFFILNFTWLLLVYRKVIDFCALTSFPAILLKMLIRFRSLVLLYIHIFVNSLGFHTDYHDHLPTERILLLLIQSYTFYFLFLSFQHYTGRSC